MARYASEAERLRAHREAFTLALQLGCTPREAERELRRRKRKRMDACGTRAPAEQPETESTEDLTALQLDDYRAWGSPWMMRD